MAVTTRRVVREIPRAAILHIDAKEVLRMVVVAYARVSTEKEEQEDSFERQVSYYTTLINSKPEWKFGGIYADPGITGTRAEKRPDFLRMIEDCRAGKINKILVKSMLNQFYNQKEEWDEYDLQMWAEMEEVMRKKYEISEISIFRLLQPERKKKVEPQPQRRRNRTYTKKNKEYWEQYEKKKEE